MRVLLLIPPMAQLNAPYPSIMQLAGSLRLSRVDVRQADLSLALAIRLFSSLGVEEIARELRRKKGPQKPPLLKRFLAEEKRIRARVEPVMAFLQGKDPTLAYRIVTREYLPEGPRFEAVGDAEGLFGPLGVQDSAKYLASLFLDEIADVVREYIDPRFGFSRYGQKLAASAPSFLPLKKELEESNTLLDVWLEELTEGVLGEVKPDLVGVSAPFSGNVYGAFRIAKVIRGKFPSVKTVLGGGYVNTELRNLSEPAVFDYFDFITLDDGEGPLEAILEHLEGKRTRQDLVRTFVREEGRVRFYQGVEKKPSVISATPDYRGLELGSYFSLLEMPNPMHRLWSDGRWNKLMLAHGCYWRKCNFCDTSLDYIARYEPETADTLVNRIIEIKRETGQSGFHFVDEAAPPALLKALAGRLLEREVEISWWGNLRFEKSFTPELVRLMARSGCIAVTGGLEVASDRLLKLMNKGVTIEQVARVARAFSDAGVMVHAYLMYGFPSQTLQETVDSLEVVRQLFEAGCIQSGFWHRFSVTAHSPIGRDPKRYGIRIKADVSQASFSVNDLEFEDPTGVDHEMLGRGLEKALYNFMQGAGLDLDVRFWFESRVPKTKVSKKLIREALGG